MPRVCVGLVAPARSYSRASSQSGRRARLADAGQEGSRSAARASQPETK